MLYNTDHFSLVVLADLAYILMVILHPQYDYILLYFYYTLQLIIMEGWWFYRLLFKKWSIIYFLLGHLLQLHHWSFVLWIQLFELGVSSLSLSFLIELFVNLFIILCNWRAENWKELPHCKTFLSLYSSLYAWILHLREGNGVTFLLHEVNIVDSMVWSFLYI